MIPIILLKQHGSIDVRKCLSLLGLGHSALSILLVL